jgi:nudix-type nucleoside diphosphatase (YffH/AdpP family)
VLGHDLGVLDIAPAELPEHASYWADGHSFPILVAEAGGRAKGLYVGGLSERDVERLNFYEGGYSYDLHAVNVVSAKGDHPTRVYFPTPGLWPQGKPWRLEDWQRDWSKVIVRAAHEAMGYDGRISPQELLKRFPMIWARAAAQEAAKDAAPSVVRGAHRKGDVEVDRHQTTHAGFFLMQSYHLRHPLFAGGMSEVVAREVFESSDAALVLPYDPVRDRVLLIEQFRMGPFGRGDTKPWTLEPVAGRIDAGETPEATAEREGMEEAGVSFDRLEHIASYYPSPGSMTEYFHSYLGLADLPDTLDNSGGLDSEHEDIRLHLLGFDAAMDLVASGEANVGPLILALMYLQRERSRLRAVA